MNSADITDRLIYLLFDTEWSPQESTRTKSKWRKEKNYYMYLDPPSIEYTVDDNMINRMKEYNELYKKAKNFVPNIEQSKTFKIFKIYNNTKKVYGYTSMSILRYIKSNLQRWLRGVDSPFSEFKKVSGVKVKLVAVVNGASKTDLAEIKNELDSKIANLNIDEVINSYKKIVKKLNDRLVKKVAFIYTMTNRDNNMVYVGASEAPIDKNKLIKQIIKKHKEVPTGEYNIKTVRKIMYTTKIGLYLILDKIIKQYNAIDKGYNDGFRYFGKLDKDYEKQLERDIKNELAQMLDK